MCGPPLWLSSLPLSIVCLLYSQPLLLCSATISSGIIVPSFSMSLGFFRKTSLCGSMDGGNTSLLHFGDIISLYTEETADLRGFLSTLGSVLPHIENGIWWTWLIFSDCDLQYVSCSIFLNNSWGLNYFAPSTQKLVSIVRTPIRWKHPHAHQHVISFLCIHSRSKALVHVKTSGQSELTSSMSVNVGSIGR